MKVMVIVKATAATEAGALPQPELLEAMMRYNEELVKAGIMQAGDGLQPTSKGARVRFSGTRREVVRGPFGGDPQDLIAGYWLWQVASLDEAIEWVKRCPNPTGEDSVIEIRPHYEIDDFGDAATPELRQKAAELRRATSGMA